MQRHVSSAQLHAVAAGEVFGQPSNDGIGRRA
jgi:hypothetical protein